MTTPYDRCSGFSERKIKKLRLNLEQLPLDDRIVLLCGSFARREAAKRSGDGAFAWVLDVREAWGGEEFSHTVPSGWGRPLLPGKCVRVNEGRRFIGSAQSDQIKHL